MSHLKMSTISFYLLLKVSRFSNTYYNNHYLRQFTELQIYILQDRKKQPYIKIPTQHYTAARSLQQKMAIFTGNLQRFFERLFEWRRFYKVWPIGGARIWMSDCLSGGTNSRIYGSWGASWGSSITVNLIWGFRYIQLKPDTRHRLDGGHNVRTVWN